ncbi:unnamed protein product [Cylicocyclus nassatus]|uniref:Methyltransferase domain-containing protein n=1 Tax=Cylicocyclus nassatus TaxID=53992 RepID=A0AA36MA39_CYLNA|nr:unnamed protein product [Cylicocyclus nassatus]
MQGAKPVGCIAYPALQIMVGILTIAVILMIVCEETPAQQSPSSLYNALKDLGNFVKNLSRIEAGVRSAWVRDFYSRQALERITNLRSAWNASNFFVLYDVIVPEVQCPNLVRVGSVVDGGKYVCNPQAIDTTMCRIYSLGLDDEISFDVQIQNITGNTCKIYGYDQQEQSKGTKDAYSRMNGKLKAVLISNEKGNRIQDFFDENGDKFTDILKIDIEGAEHNVLIPFLSNKKYKVCQILIEIHGQADAQLHLLVLIAKQGYALFSYEINGGAMSACEYGFIHMSCLKQYEAVELKRYLPSVK